MKRNVTFNELGPQDSTEVTGSDGEEPVSLRVSKKLFLGKVRVNEGDAWSVINRIYLCTAIYYSQFTHVCASC
jgi:hypothetical protein